MPGVYLTEEDVARLLSMDDALEAVEEAFRQLAVGGADNVPRQRARAAGIILHSMSAAAEYLGRVGWKQYTTTRDGARFLVGVYAAQSGQLEAVIEADRLGQLRTGAATGVAVRHLTPPTVDSVAVIGCGWQAESQLAAVTAVRSVKTVRVYCRDAERRQAFARKMSQRLETEIVAASDAREAVSNCQIVVTATTSRKPVVDCDWIADEALVCAVGSNALNRAELDVALIQRAGRVVCDQAQACRGEAGELAMAAAAGGFSWSDAVELGDIVAGKADGPASDQNPTVFKSVGLAIEDLALASRLIDIAQEHTVGRELSF